jgi:hypothetical protein
LSDKAIKTFRNKLCSYLTDLYTDFDVDVGFTDVSTAMRFEAPKPLPSRASLVRQTEELLKKDWDTLRVSTVAAEWMKSHFEKIRPKTSVPFARRIVVVSNLDMFTPKETPSGTIEQARIFHYLNMVRSIEELFQQIEDWKMDVEVEWHALRNVEHHMTIASRDRGNRKALLGAIYFHRLGKNPTISPVYLDDQEDLKVLREYFDDRTNPAMSTKTGKDQYLPLFDLKFGQNALIDDQLRDLASNGDRRVQSLALQINAFRGRRRNSDNSLRRR